MKKNYSFLLIALASCFVASAQIKETAVTTIGTMTVKISLNQATSTATLTLTGPSTRWMSLGLDCSSMQGNKDVISYGTTLLDRYFSTATHVQPLTDAQNNLTLESNTVAGTTRTLVISRPFNTGDANDHVFDFNANSLNIVWGVGPGTDLGVKHSTKGTTTLTFTTLGTETYTLDNTLTVSPNPSTGMISLKNPSNFAIQTIRLFDNQAKLIKTWNYSDENLSNNTLDLSDLTKGVYYLEASADSDKTVKKIILN
jgi:hypothetical protein